MFKRLTLFLVLLTVLLIITPAHVLAQNFHSGESIVLPAGEVVNKDYFASGPCNLDFGSSRNKCGLTVTRDGSKVTIVSTGETALRKRKLEAVLSVDQFTGKTYLVSLLEKTL